MFFLFWLHWNSLIKVRQSVSIIYLYLYFFILNDATTRAVFKVENVVDKDDSKNFILIKLYIYNENSIVKPTKLRLIY